MSAKSEIFYYFYNLLGEFNTVLDDLYKSRVKVLISLMKIFIKARFLLAHRLLKKLKEINSLTYEEMNFGFQSPSFTC